MLHFNNLHMKALYLTKRCQRCEEKFDIPNVRASNARLLIIQFYPCPHCGYVQDRPGSNTSGRCRDCSIPFSIIDHHAKGRCLRDYNAKLRYEGRIA